MTAGPRGPLRAAHWAHDAVLRRLLQQACPARSAGSVCVVFNAQFPVFFFIVLDISSCWLTRASHPIVYSMRSCGAGGAVASPGVDVLSLQTCSYQGEPLV